MPITNLMLYKAIFSLLLVALSFFTYGQNKVLFGQVFLHDTIVDARFEFNRLLLEGAIIVHEGRRKITLTPGQVDGFSYRDPITNQVRLYRSRFTKDPSTGYGFYVFVELMYQNDYVQLYQRSFSFGYQQLTALNKDRVFDYEYVFLEKDNQEIIYFYSQKPRQVEIQKDLDRIYGPNRKFLMAMFGRYRKAMKDFVKSNKLHYDSKDDVITMLEKYAEIRSRMEDEQDS